MIAVLQRTFVFHMPDFQPGEIVAAVGQCMARTDDEGRRLLPEQEDDALFLAISIFDEDRQITFSVTIEITVQDKGINARADFNGFTFGQAIELLRRPGRQLRLRRQGLGTGHAGGEQQNNGHCHASAIHGRFHQDEESGWRPPIPSVQAE